jgi:hypothetical protein
MNDRNNNRTKIILSRMYPLNSDSAVQLKTQEARCSPGAAKASDLEVSKSFALSQVVAIKLNIPSQHRRSMSAKRGKPIDFAAEGLRLALPVDRNCGIRAK